MIGPFFLKNISDIRDIKRFFSGSPYKTVWVYNFNKLHIIISGGTSYISHLQNRIFVNLITIKVK
jgi:hypothetical protein